MGLFHENFTELAREEKEKKEEKEEEEEEEKVKVLKEVDRGFGVVSRGPHRSIEDTSGTTQEVDKVLSRRQGTKERG